MIFELNQKQPGRVGDKMVELSPGTDWYDW